VVYNGLSWFSWSSIISQLGLELWLKWKALFNPSTAEKQKQNTATTKQ
jgi:hypothetical protein